jgi:hypothetical protein
VTAGEGDRWVTAAVDFSTGAGAMIAG